MKISVQSLTLIPVVAFSLVVAAPASAQDDAEEPVSFEEAQLFFELNNTDGDLGIHALIDGDEWRVLSINDPHQRRMLNVRVLGRLKRQGLTELAFESAEPGFDELEPEAFFERFPEGVYTIEGISLDGEAMAGEAEISHVLPAPAGNVQISGVAAAEDCDADPLPSVTPPVLISWDAVSESHPELGAVGEVAIDNYELVLEAEDAGLIMAVELPPSVTSMAVPEAFTGLADEFKFEILAQDENGNRTAVESCFVID